MKYSRQIWSMERWTALELLLQKSWRKIYSQRSQFTCCFERKIYRRILERIFENTKQFYKPNHQFYCIKLPVDEICSEAKRRGLFTIVDGAHVPGHIPLDLSKLEVDVYTGACHKWMMTPKGSSFLFVKGISGSI
ncbi:MAG: aminotransferase class V-fold PLP-dependent enzyme [Bacteroidetes bacterium]|nr:aminotransferase class V-fold PLP-dependent enzyme [Bacteroidota bacterium]